MIGRRSCHGYNEVENIAQLGYCNRLSSFEHVADIVVQIYIQVRSIANSCPKEGVPEIF